MCEFPLRLATQGSQGCYTAADRSLNVPINVERTLVLALGTPLRGDDGAGVAVLQAVVDSQQLPEGVIPLFNASPGDLMSALLTGSFGKVIILDAVQSGRSAGDWLRFTPADVDFDGGEKNLSGSLHNMNLPLVMDLGETLGIQFPEIVIYGIQPARMDWEQELSPEVMRAIPHICEAVLNEINQKLNKKSIMMN